MDVVESCLTWRLDDPGMGLLERAGLAALYMSLRAAEEQGYDLSPLFCHEHELRNDWMSVRWTGPAKPAFVRLFEWAWQVRDGVLYLPAVHRDARLRDNAFLRLPMHNGITATFLQHPRVQPKGERLDRVERLDENREIKSSFKPLDAAKLRPIANLKDGGFFTGTSALTDGIVSLSGWVFPGIAPRFAGERAWTGPARLGLLLMLAPLACLYQQLHAERGTWLFIMPDVVDLAEFDDRRASLTLDPAYTDVASLSDAGMQFLSEYSTASTRRELSTGCRVVAMGKVDYYPNQSIRKGVADVKPTPASLRRYRILHRVMQNRYVRRRVVQENSVAPTTARKPAKRAAGEPEAEGWFSVPTGRGRIADNLIESRPWYADLFEPFPWDRDALERKRKKNPGVSIDRVWFDDLAYQRGKLMELIQEREMWDSEADRLFVEAFWQILSALYRQEADAVERGGSRRVDERMQDLNEDIRRRLTRAKTGALLREAILDLFAKPVETYRSPIIRDHPGVVWSLVDASHDWKRARDLALLALVSYRSKEKRAAASGTATITQAAASITEGELE